MRADSLDRGSIKCSLCEMDDTQCQPAARVLDKIEPAVVAEIVGKHVSVVRRWRRPYPQGTGGAIPDADKAKLLAYAEQHAIDLTWDDFKPAMGG